MPLTFAHPAASIPLLRPLGRFGVLSALVIGSFTPDLAYILPFYIPREATHSLAGIFWFCLPAGLFTYFLYHWLLEEPLLDLVPAVRDRWKRSPRQAALPAYLAGVVISLLCGAVSHVAWDALTHGAGWLVEALPILQRRLFRFGAFPIIAYDLLQLLSTLLGLGFLAGWGWLWFRRTPIFHGRWQAQLSPAMRRNLAAAIVVIPGLTALVQGWLGVGEKGGVFAIQAFAGAAAFAAMRSLAVVTLLYSLAWQLGKTHQRAATR